jgi:hypothetical protein
MWPKGWAARGATRWAQPMMCCRSDGIRSLIFPTDLLFISQRRASFNPLPSLISIPHQFRHGTNHGSNRRLRAVIITGAKCPLRRTTKPTAGLHYLLARIMAEFGRVCGLWGCLVSLFLPLTNSLANGAFRLRFSETSETTTPSSIGSDWNTIFDDDLSTIAQPVPISNLPFDLSHFVDPWTAFPRHVMAPAFNELRTTVGSYFHSQETPYQHKSDRAVQCVWDSSFDYIGLSVNESQFPNETLAPEAIDSPLTGGSLISPSETQTPNGRAAIQKGLQCKWPKCSSNAPFTTVRENQLHIKAHARDVRKEWNADKPCTWFGCNSRAKHKSLRLFDKHLVNIHINPLICTVKECKHKSPFRGNHDLQRHIATAHEKFKYRCPYRSCGHTVREFSRTDKWLKHLRVFHDTDPCPYTHCRNGVPLDCLESTSKHIGKTHGRFECALKCCYGKISRFSDSALLEHLELDHAMEWALALKAQERAKAAGDDILRAEHVCGNSAVLDCASCGK